MVALSLLGMGAMSEGDSTAERRGGRPRGTKGSRMDPHKSRLRRMVMSGCSASEISRWLMASQGISVSKNSVLDYIDSRELRRDPLVRKPRARTAVRPEAESPTRDSVGVPSVEGQSTPTRYEVGEDGRINLRLKPRLVPRTTPLLDLPEAKTLERSPRILKMLADAAEKDRAAGLI